VIEIASSEIVLAMPRDWPQAGMPGRSPLSGPPCITLAENTPLGDALAGLLEAANWQTRSQLRVQTCLMAGSLVERGLGYAFMDGSTAAGLDRSRVAPSPSLSRLERALRLAALATLEDLSRSLPGGSRWRVFRQPAGRCRSIRCTDSGVKICSRPRSRRWRASRSSALSRLSSRATPPASAKSRNF